MDTIAAGMKRNGFVDNPNGNLIADDDDDEDAIGRTGEGGNHMGNRYTFGNGCETAVAATGEDAALSAK